MEKFWRRLTILRVRLMFWWEQWPICPATRAVWNNYIETGVHLLPKDWKDSTKGSAS